jgi:hypothetical protein
LHNDGKTIHLFEMAALDNEIHRELDTGIGQLPPNFDHLFTGSHTQQLEDTTRHKLMWLFSAWSARDNEIHVGPLQPRNTTMLHQSKFQMYQLHYEADPTMVLLVDTA